MIHLSTTKDKEKVTITIFLEEFNNLSIHFHFSHEEWETLEARFFEITKETHSRAEILEKIFKDKISTEIKGSPAFQPSLWVQRYESSQKDGFVKEPREEEILPKISNLQTFRSNELGIFKHGKKK